MSPNPSPEDIDYGLRQVEIDSTKSSAEPLEELRRYNFEGSNRTAIQDVENLFAIVKDQIDPKYETIFHIAGITQEAEWPIAETISSILESLEKDINSGTLGKEKEKLYFLLQQKLKLLARHYSGQKEIVS